MLETGVESHALRSREERRYSFTGAVTEGHSPRNDGELFTLILCLVVDWNESSSPVSEGINHHAVSLEFICSSREVQVKKLAPRMEIDLVTMKFMELTRGSAEIRAN